MCWTTPPPIWFSSGPPWARPHLPEPAALAVLLRSLAEESGLAMPGFFANVLRYAVPFLLPALALVAWWFF